MAQTPGLERLPTEILQRVLFLAPNFGLLQTSRNIRQRLQGDYVFDRLTILAFSRNSCEVDSFYTDPTRQCRYCLEERMQLELSDSDYIRRPDDAEHPNATLAWLTEAPVSSDHAASVDDKENVESYDGTKVEEAELRALRRILGGPDNYSNDSDNESIQSYDSNDFEDPKNGAYAKFFDDPYNDWSVCEGPWPHPTRLKGEMHCFNVKKDEDKNRDEDEDDDEDEFQCECAVNTREKRKLQSGNIKSPWFQLKHMLRVERQCNVCYDEMEHTWKNIVHAGLMIQDPSQAITSVLSGRKSIIEGIFFTE